MGDAGCDLSATPKPAVRVESIKVKESLSYSVQINVGRISPTMAGK